MGRLTTHVLDTGAGLPAVGVRIDVHRLGAEAPQWLSTGVTGANGRCPEALVAGAAFSAGRYSLTYFLADYFRSRGVVLADPAFIEEAVIRIGISRPDQDYHVPLLATPWSYSVYRGG